MKVKVVILFSLFFITSSLLAQKPLSKDSLLRVCNSQFSQDSSFVKALIALSRVYGELDTYDSSFAFAKKAYDLSRKISFERGTAISLNYMGIACFFRGDYPTAQEYQQKSVEHAKCHHLKTEYANSLSSLALAIQYQGNFSAATDAYLKALYCFEESKNHKGQLKVLGNMALLWREQGNLDEALRCNFRSLDIANSMNDSKVSKSTIYVNIGTVLSDQGKYSEAIDYSRRALQIDEELGYPTYYELCNIGYNYLKLNQLEEAKIYTVRSLSLAKKHDDKYIVQTTLTNLAEVYMKQNRPTQALPLFKESLGLSKLLNSKRNILLNYKGLAASYNQLQQYNLAYQYSNKALLLSDSLKNADITKKISDLQKSYELQKKESEINLLEKDAALKDAFLKEEKNLRYGLIGLATGLCIIAAIIYYSFSVKASLSKKLQKQNDEISIQKELIERINQGLKAQVLRAQMNPHFIFNSLNSIQFLIMKMESAKAFDYLAKFALLLRKVMDNSEKDLITLEEEIAVLNLYLELESLRVEGSFEYKIQSFVENPNISIPPLVVQPYIENAIQHGLLPKQGDRRLTVSFSQMSERLLCEIKDNGIGRIEAMEISKRKNKIFSSKGMKYTAERINAMNNLLGKKSEVSIIDLMEDDKNTGTLVKISFAYA